MTKQLSAEEQKQRFEEFEYRKTPGKSGRLIRGAGISDATYQTNYTNKDGKIVHCQIYSRWTNMLMRCYSKEYMKKFPTYDGAIVCEEWLRFSNFRKWMLDQDWYGKELDKDIIKQDNKVYSPETCVFVPQEVNKLLTDRKNDRGSLPLGVCYEKGKDRYLVQCSVNGKQKKFGRYKSVQEAYATYLEAKAVIIHEVACKQDLFLHACLFRIAERMKKEAVNVRASL